MEKVASKLKVLELNNLDIYGKRFNGYSIQQYISQHPETNIDISFLVNHKLGNDDNVTPLFKNTTFESLDWKIDEIEKHLATKNQISISEQALTKHPLYKKANILHFHMYHNMHLPISFLSRIPPNKKIILDLHDTFWLTDDSIQMLEAFSYCNPNRQSLNAQRKTVLHSTNINFILHSNYMANLFKKSSATKDLKYHIINFGVNLTIFKPLPNVPSLRQQYSIPADNIVLFFRAQHEFKGLNYIIEALKSLQSSRNISIITVGEIGVLQELSSSHYDIHELGLIGDEKIMSKLFNICDIFLAPSTEESFGFMAVEAMSCGKPVIVFEGTALPDTVNAPEIGISTKRNAKNLQIAIEHLILNPTERLVRGNKGLLLAQSKYDENNYLIGNEKLYKAIAAEPHPNHSIDSTIASSPATFTAQTPNLLENITSNHIDQIQPCIIDYNNVNNQSEILNFNKKLYHDILANATPAQKIRQFTPRSVKKIIKKGISVWPTKQHH